MFWGGKKKAWKFIQNLTPRNLFKRNKKKKMVHTKICTWIFIVALFITAEKWEQPKCLSVGEWIDKSGIWHGILFSNEKWTTGICYNMDVPQKDYDRSQMQKRTHYLISLIRKAQKCQIYKHWKESVITWIWDQSGDCLQTGLRECFEVMEMF